METVVFRHCSFFRQTRSCLPAWELGQLHYTCCFLHGNMYFVCYSTQRPKCTTLAYPACPCTLAQKNGQEGVPTAWLEQEAAPPPPPPPLDTLRCCVCDMQRSLTRCIWSFRLIKVWDWRMTSTNSAIRHCDTLHSCGHRHASNILFLLFFRCGGKLVKLDR